MKNLEEILELLKDAELDLAKRFRIRRIAVFGPFARGDQREDRSMSHRPVHLLTAEIIDGHPALHRAMLLWKEEKRRDLAGHLADRELPGDGRFWKPVQALFEVLPRDLEDRKLVNALLGERQTLRAEGKWEVFQDAQQRLL